MFNYEFLVNEINSSGSDKEQDHSYCSAYFELFNTIDVNNIKSFLEIGITNTVFDNSSLHAWSRIFPNAKIYGIDIAERKLFSKENISTFLADQSSILDLSRFMESINYKKIDIILDDGSHVFAHALVSFEYLINHLDNNGIYLIEDISKQFNGWQQTVSDWENYLSSRDDVKYKVINTREDKLTDDSVVIGIWKVNN